MTDKRKSTYADKPAIRLIAGPGAHQVISSAAGAALIKRVDDQTATERALNSIWRSVPEVERDTGRKFIIVDGASLLAATRSNHPDRVILSSFKDHGLTSLPTKDLDNLKNAAHTSIDAGGRGASMAQVQRGQNDVLITQPRQTGTPLGLFFSSDKNGVYRGDKDYDLGKVIDTKKLSADRFVAIVDDHEYGHVQQWQFLRAYFPAAEKHSWFVNGNIQEADADSFATLKFVRDESNPDATIGAVREYAKARLLDVTLGQGYGHDTSTVVAATANLAENVNNKNWHAVDAELDAAFNYAGPGQQHRRKLGGELRGFAAFGR